MKKLHIDNTSSGPVRYTNADSVQAVANASFGVGYIKGVRSMMIETNTFNPVANGPVNPPAGCIEPKDVTFEEAKKQIMQYFLDHHGENIDYGDLMDVLNIHLSLIVEVCAELESEGKIAAID